MDGERGYQNPLMPLSSSQRNNDFCFDYGDYVKPLFVMASGSNENQHGAGSSFEWIQCPNAPRGYVEFLKENNEDAPTAEVLESIGLTVGGSHDIGGTSGIQREVLHHDEGKPFSFRADNCYSVDIGMEKSELPASNGYEALTAFLKTDNGGEARRQFTSSDYPTQRNETLFVQEPVNDICNAFQVPSKEITSAPALSLPHTSTSSRRATVNDRQRRLRFVERLKTLQELLPYPVEGSQASVLTDIIDYIKFLQLQMKELSRSRLGGEPTSDPFIFLEGYGHYILQEQMMNESLEDMMGNLLEINPSAATQLLESRGLYMMPMSTVEGLHRLP
ncbi:hypothetical protein SLEP1_g1132 [Rubroshorea leprosula]|uniref:BHLH domain-containing protein n=1 Tax=Rubroshorea leprosula TaxID=152421 RepID=A0AAV5HME0_9ROSI|nr:hypothetical protein SLEP1_g1132 [Rubroshorea leprosula]